MAVNILSCVYRLLCNGGAEWCDVNGDHCLRDIHVVCFDRDEIRSKALFCKKIHRYLIKEFFRLFGG